MPFKDAIAQSIEWTSLSNSCATASFQIEVSPTNDLLKISPDQASQLALLIFLTFIFSISAVFLLFAKFRGFGVFLLLVVGVIGYFQLKDMKSVIFDRTKGDVDIDLYSHFLNLSSHPLNQIAGIQILPRYNISISVEDRLRKGSYRNKTYHCYELNLVFNDRNRLNLFSHKSLGTIKMYSESISNFLGNQIPTWDVASIYGEAIDGQILKIEARKRQ